MYIRHLNEGVILLNVLKLNKLFLDLCTNVVVDVVSGIILLLFYAAHIFNKLACLKSQTFKYIRDVYKTVLTEYMNYILLLINEYS